MDIKEDTYDFQEWELLQTSSDSESAPLSSPNHSNSFDETSSGGLIQANYFSLESENRHQVHVLDGESLGSDNPGWIDPEVGEEREFWPDSSSDRSEDRKFRELDDEHELGSNEKEEKEVKFEGVEGKGEEAEDLENFRMNSGGIAVDSVEFSDLGESSEMVVEGNMNSQVESPVLEEDVNANEGIVSDVGVGAESKNSGALEKRSIVWWKMPMEFLKYCMIRMSPVWTVSVAAAVVGFLVLGRRLYKMKRKTRGLEIKAAVDDKKASLVMSRVARLNEAFTVVKLVPVIRPSLPAVGSTNNWPVMSIR